MKSDNTRHDDLHDGDPPARYRASTSRSHSLTRADDRSKLQSTTRETAVTPGDQLADRFGTAVGHPVTVSTESMTVRLLGVPRVDIGEFVYAHQLDSLQGDDDTRQSALFDIENTSDKPLRWEPRHSSFIGTDSYTYRQAHLSLNPARLGPGCHTRSVTIEPGCRARAMTMVERLPSSVEVATVVHSIPSRRHTEGQRLTFAVE